MPDRFRFSEAYDPPPADRPHPSEYMDDPDVTLTLTITVPRENAIEAVDALNETLNTLAREDVLNDDYDDAWAWTGVPDA